MNPHRAATALGFFTALCVAGCLLLPGCSAFQSYPEQVRYPQNAFADLDFREAARALERVSPADRDRLCFLFELGVFYHAMGDYARSNERFFAAVEVMEEFDERAVVSLRDSAAFAASLLLNDKARPYRGSPFERVLLHTYLAMNFLLQGDRQGARVEILRAYSRQKESREEHDLRIEKTKAEAEKAKRDTEAIRLRVEAAYEDQREILERAGNVYQNAFTYYLSSVVYELGGEIGDAYIDAKTVHSLNPDFLPARTALLRYSAMLGLGSDYERWRKEFGEVLPADVPKGHGEIVLLFECGLAPVKEEIKVPVPIPGKDHWTFVTVAIPKYRMRRNPVAAARLFADGSPLGRTQPLMDVEATAARFLLDQAPALALRQTLRAGGRFAASEYARRQAGDLASVVLQLLGFVVEQADLRCWISLPRDFQALRASVPAGVRRLEMELLGQGTPGRVILDGVAVREGGIAIVNLRSCGNRGTATCATF